MQALDARLRDPDYFAMKRLSLFVLTLAAAPIFCLGCGNDDDGDGEGGEGASGPAAETASTLCVDRINQHRASIDLPPYERWADAEVCSDSEAKSDSETGTPHGAFSKCGESAQNECPGWPGTPEGIIPGCLQLMWDEGPGEDFAKHGHFLNMSSTAFTKVACGFHLKADGNVWSVQNFK